MITQIYTKFYIHLNSLAMSPEKFPNPLRFFRMFPVIAPPTTIKDGALAIKVVLNESDTSILST